METVRPWCGQPSDRRRLKNRTVRPQKLYSVALAVPKIFGGGYKVCNPNPNQGADVLSGDFQQEWFGDGGGGADALECWTRNSGRLHTGVCQCSVADTLTVEARERPSQIRPGQPARVWSTRPGVIYAGQGHEVSPG